MQHRKCGWGCLSSKVLWEEFLAREQGSALALALQPCLLLKILSQRVLRSRDIHARRQPSWLPCSAQADFLDRCVGKWAHTLLSLQEQGLGHQPFAEL